MPDLNVRNVPDDVVERLKAQAVAEGVSLSEWVRAALTDRAELPTSRELAARRAVWADQAEPPEAFAEYYRRRLRRRSA
ncbi:MAG TPA: ribbon-helix-helix protein, CopG family [Acidimicrobiia bacterium]|jgi:plasmid stability protein